MMYIDVKFNETNTDIGCDFSDIQQIDNYDEGYKAGYDEGYKAGHIAGYEAGSKAGYGLGYTAGYEANKSEWYDKGYREGESAGLERGIETGRALGYQEGYDIGYTTGHEAGKSEWYSKGYLEGESAGLERGYENGKTDGKAEGYELGFAQGKTDGYVEGYTKGQTDGVETGKQEMFDLAWSCITKDGNRKVYEDAFSNTSIKPEFFRPPVTLILTGASRNVFNAAYASEAIDGQALEEVLGYPLFDTSGATNMQYGFYGSVFTTLGEIDVQKCTVSQSTLNLFASSASYPNKLKNIKKVKCSANTDWTNTFRYATDLEHCEFEGTIGTTGLNMQHCTLLDYVSINSVFRCLSSTTSGLTVTLSKAAVDRAFETSLGAVDGSTSADWLSVVSSRSNWTISLV